METKMKFSRAFNAASLLFALAGSVALLGSGAQQASAQQDAAKQTLVIRYPNSGIALSAAGGPPYRGIVYVKIYPVSPDLVKRYGAGPVAAAELSASQRDVRLLPLGEYEVHFAVRKGVELKTFILRNVILRADRADTIGVEMSDEAKTTIIGGDMTAQQMAETIRQLQSDLAALKQQVADLKRN